MTASRFTVRPDTTVQWQVISQNAAAAAKQWQTTDDLVTNGTADWSFTVDTGDHDTGPKTIVVRLVHHGVEIARDTARVRFR